MRGHTPGSLRIIAYSMHFVKSKEGNYPEDLVQYGRYTGGWRNFR